MRHVGIAQKFFRRKGHLFVLLFIMVFLVTRDNFKVHNFHSHLPFSKFEYPLQIDMPALIRAYRSGGHVEHDPINLYKYTYVTNITDKCRNGTKIFLLFLIKSAVRNFERRNSIRATWGKEGTVSKEYAFKTIFMVGMPKEDDDVNINENIKQEIITHNDILQMTFRDDYYNNTQKTVGGIHWAVQNCGHAQFVMFVDDDFYIATPLLIAYLSTISEQRKKTLFMGSVHSESAPERLTSSKWFISRTDYRYNIYPPFISAGAMVISMQFLKDVQVAIQYTKNFRYDDVFLAIVVYKLRIYPQNNVNIQTGDRVDPNSTFLSSLLASHGYNNDVHLKAAWRAHNVYTDALRKVLQIS